MLHYTIVSEEEPAARGSKRSLNQFEDEVDASSEFLVTIEVGDILPESTGYPRRKVVSVLLQKF